MFNNINIKKTKYKQLYKQSNIIIYYKLASINDFIIKLH